MVLIYSNSFVAYLLLKEIKSDWFSIEIELSIELVFNANFTVVEMSDHRPKPPLI